MEKPGRFYLGKAYDMSSKEILEQPILYDARDLTTHAICVGMTGSGKTGLCTLILEEAALNGVPSIIIDPKGDITNLLLTFPDLRPEDFEPWVNPDDARRKGQTIPEYATQIAQTWANGLAQWGQGPERIRRLKSSADFAIYTPGSDAGYSVSILDSMRAPSLSWDDEEDTLRERISSTVSALLGLIGVKADPLKSREHILLSNIFEHAWRQGEDLDIAKLISLIQKPPVRKLGVFDVDTFFPQNDRFGLAMSFNNILAAPSFENWISGQPLDVQKILYTPEGKPRAAVFYIAHLDDAQRMFFVTLLLEQIITWMRGQSGTTSLRGLVYFDEIYGYFPPYPANPPTKSPLMVLLKQARAFGLGMILTTQNPVDLDYKGLTNAGTWFVGKLQTDRDKMRVLEGLEGAIGEAGATMDRRELDRAISALSSRVFLLHNVHDSAPQVFMTRWAMSYLRGPLTRRQIRELMKGRPVPVAAAAPVAAPAAVPAVSPASTPPVESAAPIPQAASLPHGLSRTMPQADPAISQFFLVPDISAQQALRQEEQSRRFFSLTPQRTEVLYEPKILAWCRVNFENKSRNVYHHKEYQYLAEQAADPALIHWEQAEIALKRNELDGKPASDALFADIPQGLGQARNLKAMEASLAEYLYRQKQLVLWHNPSLKLYSEVGESAEEFEQRCKKELARLRDQEADKIKASYDTKIGRVRERLQRTERSLAKMQSEHEARKREEILHIGESILQVITRKRAGRALSTASRKRAMTTKAANDMRQSEDIIADLQKEIEALQQELQDALADLDIRMAQVTDQREEYLIKPRRMDVKIDWLGIGWVPQWHITGLDSRGRETEVILAAFRG